MTDAINEYHISSLN